jgi:hypothetical protein
MTRETKVGLIVAGSFLCLVCIVVASKWRRGDDPSKEPEEQTIRQVAAVKPTQNPSAAESKKKDDAKKNDWLPHGVLPALSPHPESKDVASPPIDRKDLPALMLPPPVTKPGELVLPQPVVVDPRSAAPTFPIAQDTDKNKGPTFPIAPAGVQFPPPQPLAPLDDKKGGPIVIAPALVDRGPPAFPADTQPVFPPVSKDTAPVFRPFTGNDPPPAIGAKDIPPAFPPTVAKDAPPAFPAPKTLDTATTLPPLGTPTPLTDKAASIPGAPNITPPLDMARPIMPTNPGDTPRFPPITDAPYPVPRIGGSDLPSTPAITMNPNKSVLETTVPPIIVGGIKPLPVPKEVNSDSYTCQSGDTSFAMLSRRLYGTEKYADALLAYNRDNYKATVNGSAFLVNPPRLAQGQQVHIAPIAILERDYRPYIGTASVSVIPTIPSSAPPASLARPTPLSAPSNPGIATISNPPSTGKGGTYVVQSPNGESILDIAERVLGDRSQWHKIWRVNPSYQPQFRIPAGTKLEVPAS